MSAARAAKHRETSIPFRAWPWRARLVEKLYRATHGGQIRTLVVQPGEWDGSIEGEM